MTKETSNKFKWLSFLMTCAIVIYHINGSHPVSYHNSFDEKVFNNIYYATQMLGSLAVGYFFATTGYFLYGDINIRNVNKRIRNRVHTLLIPFFAWNFIYFVFNLLKGYQMQQETLLKEIFDKVIFDPFAGALWYVLVIFVLSLLAPLTLIVLKRKMLAGILYVVLCIGSYYISVVDKNTINIMGYG